MKIAVVGSGISGLGAALILSGKHDISLFEASDRLGGHANTVSVRENASSFPVDTGFLVYNEHNYPHLTALFRYLGVKTSSSDMSLSVRLEKNGLEWCGTDLNSVFAQRKNLFSPSFYKMLFSIMRFHREAQANLQLARENGWTLRGLLRARRYPRGFASAYLLPMGAAIWSTPEENMLDFPAETLLAFFLNHRLLQVNGRPQWRTVTNGSINYVSAIAQKLPNIHLRTPVHRVTRKNGKVILATDAGPAEFDQVVLATHAPVTARILQYESEAEEKILKSFRVEANKAVLHGDPRAMPRAKRAWSSWNALSMPEGKASLTYHLNRLQPLPTTRNVFVSLNPHQEFKNTERVLAYDHPLFDFTAIRAQSVLPEIQGRGGVYYAGAWTRYGFHEDGLRSAVKVAELLGVPAPWQI